MLASLEGMSVTISVGGRIVSGECGHLLLTGHHLNKLELHFGSPLRVIVAKEEPQIYARLTISDTHTTITAKGDVMYTMPIKYQVKVKVAYVDAGGNPAVVDGPVVWSSSDPAVVTVNTDPTDSSMCTVQSLSEVGQAQVLATADADLGTGTRSLVTTMDITIVAGEAVAGTIQPVGDAAPYKGK